MNEQGGWREKREALPESTQPDERDEPKRKSAFSHGGQKGFLRSKLKITETRE
jgi:hypothetical protein